MKDEVVVIGETSKAAVQGGAINRGLSIMDLIFRLVAIIGTLGSAISMGTTNETLPFFTQFIRFKAQYDDLPTFTYTIIHQYHDISYIFFNLWSLNMYNSLEINNICLAGFLWWLTRSCVLTSCCPYRCRLCISSEVVPDIPD
jgi:Domain of unknown function (DUF588)